LDSAYTSLAELFKAKKTTEWSALKDEYNSVFKEWSKAKDGVHAVRHLIKTTIGANHYHYVVGTGSVRDDLLVLKKLFKQDTNQGKKRLNKKYTMLLAGPSRHEHTDAFMEKWLPLIYQCRDVDLPRTRDEQPAEDFFEFMQNAEPEFADWHLNASNGLAYTIEDAITAYRKRALNKSSKPPKGNVNATFQGRSNDSEPKKPSRKARNDWPCRKKHLFKDCEYVVQELRAPGWKAAPAIEQKFNDIANKNAGFKAALENARKTPSSKNMPKDANDLAAMHINQYVEVGNHNFYSTAKSYILRDSFIADIGSDIHFCNDIRHSITHLKKARCASVTQQRLF
jgi:hypothetical protein